MARRPRYTDGGPSYKRISILQRKKASNFRNLKIPRTKYRQKFQHKKYQHKHLKSNQPNQLKQLLIPLLKKNGGQKKTT